MKDQSDGRVGPLSSGRRWDFTHGLRPSRASRDLSTNGSRWARWVRKHPRMDGSWTHASRNRAPTVWREGEACCLVCSWSLSSPSSMASGPPLCPSLGEDKCKSELISTQWLRKYSFCLKESVADSTKFDRNKKKKKLHLPLKKH